MLKLRICQGQGLSQMNAGQCSELNANEFVSLSEDRQAK